MQFCSDPAPEPCDGLIYDSELQTACRTEHVVALAPRDGTTKTADEFILEAVAHKVARGKAYAGGKILVVLMIATTAPWLSNQVAKELPQLHGFIQVWVVNLHVGTEENGYIYNVAHLDVSERDAPAWRVHIADDFENWHVEIVQ